MAVRDGLIDLTEYEAGVYLIDPEGEFELVHPYEGSDFRLADIVEFFELGELLEEDGAPGLELDDKEVRALKKAAQEFEGDHPEEFIACCRAMVKSALAHGEPPYCFYSNFA